MWDVALVAAALGLSNFAASIGIGLSGVNGRLRIRIVLIFGFFEAAMPLTGLLIGHRVASSVGSAAHFLGGGLLIATGIFSVIQVRRPLALGAAKSFQPGRLIVTGAALGIDNLVIGFSLGAYKVSVLWAGVVVAAISVGMSLVGLEIGNRLGASIERWSSEIGGLVLILVGIAIATGVF